MKAYKVKLIVVIILLSMQLFAQSNPGMDIQDAIKKEQVDGDLKAAIAIYQKISARQLRSAGFSCQGADALGEML